MTIQQHIGSNDVAAAKGLLHEYEEQYANDPDYIAERLALRVTEEAAKIMQNPGLSRADLAARMNVSRAYVTKIFDAPPNLTLRSIARLALALGVKPYVSLLPPRISARVGAQGDATIELDSDPDHYSA